MDENQRLAAFVSGLTFTGCAVAVAVFLIPATCLFCLFTYFLVTGGS